MTKQNPDELQRRIEALQERVSKLCGAVLRISASLDLDTVLQEVVDSARALTGARYGVITTVDEAGRPQEFVGSGITPDEHRQLAEWADGLRLFEHLRDLPGALRVADLPAYVRSLGFSTDLLPYKTLQGTPMRHCGVHVGSFFLAEKEAGREFTSADEEVLVIFASQAAAAIANARTYRDERRARADMEALVETSPVGVAVFDARTGALASLNREAKPRWTPKSGHWWTAENRPFPIAARDVDAGRELGVPARHEQRLERRETTTDPRAGTPRLVAAAD